MSDRIRIEIDPDLEDLIPGFLANRARDVEAIRALVDSDPERVRMLGHSMKGAGGGYGFDAITALGARIEKAALARDRAAVLAATDELADYLQRVEPVTPQQ